MIGEPKSVASSDTSDKDTYIANDARLGEIKGKISGDLSDEELDVLVAERKALKSAQTEKIGRAQEEATTENAERVAELARKAAEAKAVEDAARAEQAAVHAAIAAEDAAKAAALAEQIQGGKIGVSTSEVPTPEPLHDAHVDAYKTHVSEEDQKQRLAEQDVLEKQAEQSKKRKERREMEVEGIFRKGGGGQALIKSTLGLFKGGSPAVFEEYRSVVREQASLIRDEKVRNAIMKLTDSGTNMLSALIKGPITPDQRATAESDYVARSIASVRASGEYTAEELREKTASIKSVARERYDNFEAVRDTNIRQAEKILEEINVFL